MKQKSIGEKIKYYRELRKFSVNDLAERAHIPADNIRKYERGDRNPKLDAINALANALGLNVNTLLDTEIKTASDAAPYLFKIGNACGIEFSGKQNGEGLYTDTVSISFKNELLNDFIRHWANRLVRIANLRQTAEDTIDEETKKYMMARADMMEEDLEENLLDSMPFRNSPDGKHYVTMTDFSFLNDKPNK